MSENRKEIKNEIVNNKKIKNKKTNNTSLNKEGGGKNKTNRNLFSVHKNGEKGVKENKIEQKFEINTEKVNNKLKININKTESNNIMNNVKSNELKDKKEIFAKNETNKNMNINNISNNNTENVVQNNNMNNKVEKIIQTNNIINKAENFIQNNNSNNKNENIIQNCNINKEEKTIQTNKIINKAENIIQNNIPTYKNENIIQNCNINKEEKIIQTNKIINKAENILQNNFPTNKNENIIQNCNINSKEEKLIQNNNNNNRAENIIQNSKHFNREENTTQNNNNNKVEIPNLNGNGNNKEKNIIQSNNSNNNYIEKATINNNFIINKDNPLMINTNLANSNIINNNIKNSTINNNYIIRNNNDNNKNNNDNINNINFELNNLGNNYINDLSYKENIINRNNIERNNFTNNIRFMRGQSVQPKTNRNSFLNTKHHLLENAIIKNQYEEPKSKVILKNEKYPYNYNSNIDPYNTKSFQKIISLDESDSENFFYSSNNKYDNDISQDYDEEDYDDEEYHLNTSEYKNSRRNNRKNNINSNFNFISKKKDPEEILFDELNYLIRKYTFLKTVQYIIKYYTNDLPINSDKSEDNEIIKRLNNLLSKYDKNAINTPLMNILQNLTRESQDLIVNLKNLPDKRFSPIEIKDSQKERSQRRGRSQKMILNKELIKEKRKHTKKPSPPFYYGKHFFKVNDKVYTYVPKAKTASLNRYTLYCMYRAKVECMAKIIVHQNDNKISYIGNHICNPKLTVDEFYEKYPYIKKEPDWTHIQFAVENEKPFILSRT